LNNLGKKSPRKKSPRKKSPRKKITPENISPENITPRKKSPRRQKKISPKVGKNPPSDEHLHISVYRLVVNTSVIFDRWNGAIVIRV